MKRIMVMALLAGLLGSVDLLAAQAQDTPDTRKVVYLLNPDYPPAGIVDHPTQPVQITHFWQVLDQEMHATKNLALSESMENADYRVEMKCAGITYCSKLRVYVQSPQRDVLSAFTLNKVKSPFSSVNKAQMSDVAKRLAQRLQTSISQLEEGGYGYH